MFIIVMGVSGCGKTTIGKKIAEAFEVPYYEGDAFHPPENVDKMSRGVPLTDEDRRGWLEVLAELIRDKLDAGESGVLACSALKGKYRQQLRISPDRVWFVYLKGDYETIHTRIQERTGHYMPPGLLKSQFEALEEPDDAFTIDINQPVDVILGEVMGFLRWIGFAALL
jgi:carbohydrate kinase (thermoresistant glucokinase family)